MSIEISNLAEWDMESLAGEIFEKAGPFASGRFADRLGKTLSFLERFPISGELIMPGYDTSPGLRAFGVRQYPNHVIYFTPKPDGIRVLRVLRASRDLDAIFDS